MVVITPGRGGGGDGRMKFWKIQKTSANSLFVLKRETGTLNKNSGENVQPYPH